MRKIILLLVLTISLSVSATSEDTLHAVTMVSYEQGWLDSEGTLALKNNTDKDIHNVAYRITYFDMKGNALDYEDFTSKVDIAPGLTRKVNIPAYEHERSYSYYRSEAVPGTPHKFKIKFELTGYNIPQKHSENKGATDVSIPDESFADTWFPVGLALIIGLSSIGFYIGMYVLVAIIAKNRNRNEVLWILLSIFLTPLLTIVILLCLGRASDSLTNQN